MGGGGFGWVGERVEDNQNVPFLFLIFRYVKKEGMLILNVVSKIVSRHQIKSYQPSYFKNSKL